MEHLKVGDDWQKVFESLTIIKRICMFHKDVIAAAGGSKDLIKHVVKHTDNLRSQVAKNAAMTI